MLMDFRQAKSVSIAHHRDVERMCARAKVRERDEAFAPFEVDKQCSCRKEMEWLKSASIYTQNIAEITYKGKLVPIDISETMVFASLH